MTTEEKEIVDNCLTDVQIVTKHGVVIFESFEKLGHTAPIIDGTVYYYRHDFDRFIAGLPVVD